jgi:uncharacterized membrane protein YqgA involved in biofilm formation
VLNVVAIAAGASIGTLLGGRLPERLRDTLVAALGLFTLALGVQQALAAFGDDLSGAVGRSAPLLVLAIGLRLLGLARIRVANLLPAVLLAPLATGLVAAAR